MSFSSTQIDHPAQALREDLEKCVTRKDAKEKCFVSKKSIEKLWPDDSKILKAKLGLCSWDTPDELLSLLDRECRTIICILAWIRYEPFGDKLKEIAYAILKEKQGQLVADLKDSRLILDEEVCIRNFDSQSGRLFYQDQFIFCPISISSTQKGVQEVHPSRRWPYKSSPSEIGLGAFGSVFKVSVVKGQFRDTAGHSNDEDELVAFKSVHKSADWRKEVMTLDFLKESLSEHKHLTLHIAALIQNDRFYIFMHYTPLGDLENFLQEGVQHDEIDGNLYDFSQRFSSFGTLDLATEFALVVDATAYLHDRVSSARGIAVFCAHADLRPTNILIFPPDGRDHPAGIWRISDFGISSVKLEDDQTLPEPMYAREPAYAQDHPSMGDIVQGRWNPSGSRSALHRLNGTHVAPERSISRIYKPKESDVWSLGCIFMEVLVFSLGTQQKGNRKGELGKFRAERTSFRDADRDDYFYDLVNVSTAVVDNRRITIVRRPKVDEWLQYLGKQRGSLCRELAEVVHEMLQPQPDARCRAKKASEAILKACMNDGDELPALPNGRRSSLNDAEVQTSLAEPWKFLASRDSSGNLTFREDISQSGQEESASKTSITSRRSSTVQSVSLHTLQSTVSTSLLQFQRTQTLRIRRGSVDTRPKDASGLSKPAIKVQVSSSCGTVVYLCQCADRSGSMRSSFSKKGSAYELRFGQAKQPDRDSEAPRSHRLPSHAKWHELHVDGHFAIVSEEQRRSNTTVPYIYDFASQSELGLPSDPDFSQMRKFISSVHGVFIAYDAQRFVRWQSDRSCTRHEVSPPIGAHGQIVFGHTGAFLFTWSCKSQEDVINVWDMVSDTGPVVCATYLVLRPSHRAPYKRLLYPCGSFPACILHDGSGTWFTASAQRDFSNDRKPIRAVEQRNLDLKHPKHDILGVADEHYFFYISTNSEVRMCDLIWSDDNTLNLHLRSEPLHKIGSKGAKSMNLCTQEDGTRKLVICNHEGAIESIEIETRK